MRIHTHLSIDAQVRCSHAPRPPCPLVLRIRVLPRAVRLHPPRPGLVQQVQHQPLEPRVGVPDLHAPPLPGSLLPARTLASTSVRVLAPVATVPSTPPVLSPRARKLDIDPDLPAFKGLDEPVDVQGLMARLEEGFRHGIDRSLRLGIVPAYVLLDPADLELVPLGVKTLSGPMTHDGDEVQRGFRREKVGTRTLSRRALS